MLPILATAAQLDRIGQLVAERDKSMLVGVPQISLLDYLDGEPLTEPAAAHLIDALEAAPLLVVSSPAVAADVCNGCGEHRADPHAEVNGKPCPNDPDAEQAPTAEPAPAAAATVGTAEQIAAKEAELEAARAALVANYNRQVGGSSRTKQHGIRIDAQIRRGAEHARTVERLERELTALRRPVQPEPQPVTPETLNGAKYVRTRYGWHKVVRVNRTSVTVETGYSWTDRIQLGKILEARV